MILLRWGLWRSLGSSGSRVPARSRSRLAAITGTALAGRLAVLSR